ncbi:uncharacterized protein YdhG (YjbR/CyaY superfamily) [Filimonas zeae]|uniref:YdhG-like domain-containing protein n=1 Tax=Filimonas zeae TaxID=1737353 RepID=A0A917J0V0_9BACT|nr:DUF1801 domain-containing protein [Filimonas zeae]MDR6340162.1 uncharacterized protein YdhG (YjbR/CyaY superfamily) [Filimonas zeae]GGH71438.1 hypothetical protein GCM10011379_30780 [Filimonas zeae]
MQNKTDSTAPQTIDGYIKGFTPDVQEVLQLVRDTIRAIVPDATEAIKYAIPTFIYGKANLVHFAAFKAHIGFYPAPTGIKAFEEELAHYVTGKGSVQFPLDKPMPLNLITRMVNYRIEEVHKQQKKKK